MDFKVILNKTGAALCVAVFISMMGSVSQAGVIKMSPEEAFKDRLETTIERERFLEVQHPERLDDKLHFCIDFLNEERKFEYRNSYTISIGTYNELLNLYNGSTHVIFK